ncbi:MAG: aryl-sulfate sulfotransferase [Alphaproteobacteria bacterium]|nr:aryl-sulfate sulfotransferase [Alphaproteobacteria bacterium]MCB9696161.1 aryl-sulfate sulfotransferase [Alphaproteobacteria bacterium]
MWWLWSCLVRPAEDVVESGSPAEPPAPGLVVRASVPDADTPLVWRIEVDADEAFAGALEVGDLELSLEPAATHHERLLVGLAADTPYTVTAIARGPGPSGGSASFRTDPLPAHFPEIVRLADDSPASHLLPLHRAAGTGPSPDDAAIVLDGEDRVVWWHGFDGTLQDVTDAGDGVWALVGDDPAELRHVRWDGVVTERWALPATAITGGFDGNLHHDVGRVGEGTVVLARRPLEVPDYPASTVDRRATEARTVSDDVVLRLDAAGAVVGEVAVSSFLPTSRIGYDSLGETVEGWADWAHANAVSDDAGETLLTLRNQDLVVKLDAAGRVRWVFGQERDLSSDLVALRLTPTDAAPPFWHAHGAHLGPVEADGTRLLTLFDNGTWGAAPFTDVSPITDPVSRVVAYRIDEWARTVTELWSYRRGELYGEVVGDVTPTEDGVLATFGHVTTDPFGTPLKLQGFGRVGATVVELRTPAPGAQPELAWGIDVRSRREANEAGWVVARAERIPELWGRNIP